MKDVEKNAQRKKRSKKDRERGEIKYLAVICEEVKVSHVQEREEEKSV